MQTPSGIARFAPRVGAAGAAAVAGGPALIHAGALSPFAGFRLFLLGALLGIAGLVMGALGLWRTRAASGRRGRGRAWAGTALGLAVAAIALHGAFSARGLPAINDITTDFDDPPALRSAAQIPPNRGRDLGYPGEAFASQQRAAYPDLAPIRIALPPREAFQRAREVAAGLGWEITLADPASGVLEATEVTRVFRFVDDIAVRVRAAPGGSVVDLRSKSRDGRGDLGANAARIRAFREAMGPRPRSGAG